MKFKFNTFALVTHFLVLAPCTSIRAEHFVFFTIIFDRRVCTQRLGAGIQGKLDPFGARAPSLHLNTLEHGRTSVAHILLGRNLCFIFMHRVRIYLISVSDKRKQVSLLLTTLTLVPNPCLSNVRHTFFPGTVSFINQSGIYKPHGRS